MIVSQVKSLCSLFDSLRLEMNSSDALHPLRDVVGLGRMVEVLDACLFEGRSQSAAFPSLKMATMLFQGRHVLGYECSWMVWLAYRSRNGCFVDTAACHPGSAGCGGQANP